MCASKRRRWWLRLRMRIGIENFETGAPETIRTSDLCLRRATLYPAELRARALRYSRSCPAAAMRAYRVITMKSVPSPVSVPSPASAITSEAPGPISSSMRAMASFGNLDPIEHRSRVRRSRLMRGRLRRGAARDVAAVAAAPRSRVPRCARVSTFGSIDRQRHRDPFDAFVAGAGRSEDMRAERLRVVIDGHERFEQRGQSLPHIELSLLAADEDRNRPGGRGTLFRLRVFVADALADIGVDIRDRRIIGDGQFVGRRLDRVVRRRVGLRRFHRRGAAFHHQRFRAEQFRMRERVRRRRHSAR